MGSIVHNTEHTADNQVTKTEYEASTHHVISGLFAPELTSGLDASKPAAGTAGRLFWATDTLILYRDTGAAWVEILRGETVSRLALLSERTHASLTGIGASDHHAAFTPTDHDGRDHRGRQLFQSGPDTSKPAAGSAGRIYYATDTKILYLDSGTTWDEILRGETVSRLASLSEKSHVSLTGVTTDQHHPQSHASAHADAGADEITSALDPAAYPMLAGTLAARPAFGVAGRFYWATDEGILYRDSGSAWVKVAVRDHADLDGITATDHHSNVNDPIAGEKAALPGTSGTPSDTNKYVTDADARNTNARTPTAHRTTHVSGGGDGLYVMKAYAFAVVGTLTVGTDKAPTLEAIATETITEVRLVVKTAPTGAAIIVDVNKNGTTIFTTQSNRPQIAISATEGQTTTIEVSGLVKGDNLTIDIDQVGSTTAGADLTVIVMCRQYLTADV